jgi:hypothetical protein
VRINRLVDQDITIDIYCAFVVQGIIFEECAAVRCTIGCLLALIFLTTFFFAIYAIRKQEQRKLHTVKFNKRGTATINKGLMLDLS